METRKINMSIMMDRGLSKRLVDELGCLYYSYSAIVEEFVRERYTINEELSIQRQRDTKTEEFAEYNTFVESCKARAKEIWARQEEAVSRIMAETQA